MPFLFGRAGKAAVHRFIPATAPAITFDNFDLSVGTKQVTIRAVGGITHVGYTVFANSPPGYPWYAGSTFDNVALGSDGSVTVTVTTFAAGDKIKAFKSAASPVGPASRDLSVYVDSLAATGTAPPPSSAMGPLARAATSGVNKIWLARPDGSVPVLVGSHNWSAPFQDYAAPDPPEQFDFQSFINFTQASGFTFIRGWRWENFRDDTWNSTPHPWRRTGPGTASDGKPKFDLTQFDPAFAARYQARLQTLQNAGIYVGVMLFNLWSVSASETGAQDNWIHHPFQPGNNINGVDARGLNRLEGAYNLANSALMAVQNAYLDHMVDICNPYPNVIYETCNEPLTSSAMVNFFNHVVDRVQSYQITKPNQHPVWYSSPACWEIGGCGGTGAGDYSQAQDSNADVVGVTLDPGNPEMNSDRPWAADIDHSYGLGGGPDWCWRNFTRGMQFVLNMDSLNGIVSAGKLHFNLADNPPSGTAQNRFAMSAIAQAVTRIGGSLRDYGPSTSFSSTQYALAKSGGGAICYSPSGGSFTANLSGWGGNWRTFWVSTNDSSIGWQQGTTVAGGATRTIAPPSGISGSAAVVLIP